MYEVNIHVRLKRELTRKTTYEKTAILIRAFIHQNNKELRAHHYDKTFSYYCFSSFSPLEKTGVYPEGNTYTIKLRSLHKEFLDLKHYRGLETTDLSVVDVNAGKLFYKSEGSIKTETPVFFNTKRIDTPDYEQEVKERIRENMIFRYLKSEDRKVIDVEDLRSKVVKTITIFPKVITIPYETKKLQNGHSYLYHCFHVDIQFQDNPWAKEVERVVYGGGLGLNTSNGFGFIKQRNGVG